MGVDLKPCPFCGGEAMRHTIGEEEPNNAGGDVIVCTRCQASSHVEFGRKENIVSRWNTRATPPEPSSEVVGGQDRKFAFRDGQYINRVSGEAIPLDEPIIIFRARDWHALDVLSFYQGLATDGHHVRAIQDRINEFQAFKDEHPHRMKEPGITHDVELASRQPTPAPAADAEVRDGWMIPLLREALQPFADMFDQIGDDESDDEWAKFRLLVGDYRRARSALRATTLEKRSAASPKAPTVAIGSKTLRDVMASGDPEFTGGEAERRGWFAGYDAAVAERTAPAVAIGAGEVRAWKAAEAAAFPPHEWDRYDRPRTCQRCEYVEHDGSGIGWHPCSVTYAALAQASASIPAEVAAARQDGFDRGWKERGLHEAASASIPADVERDRIAAAIANIDTIEAFHDWVANHSTYPNCYKSSVDTVYARTDRVLAALAARPSTGEKAS